MKLLAINRGRLYKLRSLLVFAVALTSAQPASAQGLEKARGVLETFQTEMTSIVPLIAAIMLLVIGIGYAGRFLEKDTAVRWAVGVIIAGSAVQLTALFFS